jgi:acetyl-CoA acetyltransferase
MTAGNSTPLTDGASTLLLASDEWAQGKGLPVLAHLIDAQTAAVDYVHGGEGLLMAPVYAMPVMLARNGLSLQDFDFYEIHEAFASTVLATLKAWEDPAFCKEKLARLKPVFGKGDPAATMTAGNSTPLSDGASAVLLASDEWAAEHHLPVLAHFVDAETGAVDYVHGNPRTDGLLMAPIYVVPRLLARNQLGLADFDFVEIHEAFASTVLMTLAAWADDAFCREQLGLSGALGTIDRDKLNVNGSSLAAGHPFAATGGRIVANLAKLLDAKGSGRGLISICAAGGQGVTAILER